MVIKIKLCSHKVPPDFPQISLRFDSQVFMIDSQEVIGGSLN